MATSNTSWTQMILENLGYKMISLGLAILLWLYVNAERNPMGTKQFREALKVQNLGDKLIVLSQSPDQTTVTIEGLQRTLGSIDADAIDVYIDCAGLGPGEHRLPVRYVLGENYKGSVTVDIKDRFARVSIDQQTGKTMEIEFQSLTSPAAGYAFGIPVINPPRAAVSGIGKDVSKVTRLVASLEVGVPPGGDVEKTVRLTPLDDNGNEVSGVKITPAQTRIKLPVKELPVTRVVFITPDIRGYPQPPHRVDSVEVVPDRVTLNGSRKTVEGVTAVFTEPIDVSEATETFQKDVDLKPLPGAVTMDRERVRVTVRIAR